MSTDKSFRNELLARYGETQARQASPAVYEDPSAAWPYYEANYRSMLEPLSREIRICEVGSGHGSLDHRDPAPLGFLAAGNVPLRSLCLLIVFVHAPSLP